MRVITKQEFLKMLDEHIPDDAQISATSVMAGESFEITPELIAEMLPDLAVMEEQCGVEEDVLSGSTHILYTP